MVTPRERNEILSHFKAQGVNNLAVLSGDTTPSSPAT